MSKVSIIVPCYNQAHFLGETLDSILAQTYTDWECLVINDGSPDDTAKVAERFSLVDARIRHVPQDNRGLSGARNRGLDEAKGEWIQFLDADDILLPNKLKRQMAALGERKELSLSYCDYYYCTETNIHERIRKGADFEHPRLSDSDPLIDLISRWGTSLSIPVHCFLFDARLFGEYKLRFDEDLPNHEDWDCWVSVISLGPRVVAMREELAIYRQHAQSMCADRALMWRGYSLAIRKQMKNFRGNSVVYSSLNDKHKQMEAIFLQRQGGIRQMVRNYLRRGKNRVRRVLVRGK